MLFWPRQENISCAFLLKEDMEKSAWESKVGPGMDALESEPRRISPGPLQRPRRARGQPYPQVGTEVDFGVILNLASRSALKLSQ